MVIVMTELNGDTWKYIAGVEGAAILSMVGWWIKVERPRLAELFKQNEVELKRIIKESARDRTLLIARLKDLYDRVGTAFKIHEDLVGHTELDFDAGKVDD